MLDEDNETTKYFRLTFLFARIDDNYVEVQAQHTGYDHIFRFNLLLVAL